MKSLVRALLAVPLALSLSGCYLLQQGAGQAQLLMSRQSVSEVLANPATPETTKAKLALIAEAKAFAEQRIGLKASRNYESFVPLDRDAVTYVVGAAPKDKLVAYTWWFPIVGSVPYKGYFDKRHAEAERDRLKAEDYDTLLRGVPAFSTLGWLPDPIYSPFLRYDDATLANVIIHELTHVTLYLPGQASFNEGFATFVGNVGAQEFLKEKYGADSPQYRQAVDAVADNALFTAFIQELSAKLDALYNSDRSRAEKLAEREKVFAWGKEHFKQAYLPRMKTRSFQHFAEAPLNNAVMISNRTYYNQLDRFEAAHRKLGGDLRKTVAFFRDTVAKASDPEAYLEEFLKTP